MEEATRGSAESRTVDAGRGITWWSEAWTLFTKNAGMWIALALISCVIFVVLALLPVLGSLATSLLAPVFAGGWLLAARKVENGGALEVGDLFAGFKERLTPLLILGAVMLAASLVIMVVAGALGIGAVMGLVVGGANQSVGGVLAAISTGMLALLVALTLGALAAMAIWFAPALVVFRNVAPVDALRASFSACMKNIVPFLLYSVIYIIAAIVATIPLGLGWLVLLPVLFLTDYVSYKDLFGE